MKIACAIVLACTCLQSSAQQQAGDTITTPDPLTFDTVYIRALNGKSGNIPFSITELNTRMAGRKPRPQLMQQLSLLPSVSAISAGGGINKPIIRGLSFNQVTLSAMGTRMDNQSWDDRHDIGIPATGNTDIQVINGPASVLYGPGTMGGALVFHEKAPVAGEKTNGYVNTTFFSNSIGANLDAGLRGAGKEYYFSVNTGIQSHTNYLQGGSKVDGERPMAFNSKYTNAAFKGMAGIRRQKHTHQLNYSYYKQLLGIIEDENLEAINNPGKKAERDYEMEAPYQDVQTHVISLENRFQAGNSTATFNAAYQFNKRKEFEPAGTGPKSKFLAVALDLQTVSVDLQWQSDVRKKAGVTFGAQAFGQHNKNFGNWVLVPDARIQTVGAFGLFHWNPGRFNILAGARMDGHHVQTYATHIPQPDTFNASFPAPEQAVSRRFTPFSFNLGGVYHFSDVISIKANLATGYASPNYAQLTSFGRHEGTYRFEIGDNDLDMSQNLEADFVLAYRNKNVKAEVRAYSNRIGNYIFLAPTPDSVKDLKVYQWSQQDATIKGIEFEISIRPDFLKKFEWFANAGALRGRLRDNDGNLPYIPATKVVTGITFHDGNDNWQDFYASYQFSAYGSQDDVAAFESSTAGYCLSDLSFGVHPPLGQEHRWQLVVFCNNLFNKKYYSHTSLIKSIGVSEPGRNAGLQVGYKF